MKDTYHAAIIGLGFVGAADQVSGDALGQRVEDLDGTHVAAYEGNPRIQVVAGSSRDEERRHRFARRTGARVHSDWQRMLESEAPDIVSVATYTPAHAAITCAAAEAGASAILCEKPIAPTLAQAERMIAACRDAGALLAINHNRRFSGVYRRLADAIADGALGTVTSATLRWGAGRLGNVGTHMIDALAMLTRQRPAAVSGTLDTAGRPDCRGREFHDPGGWGLIRYDGGLVATVDAADYAAGPPMLLVHGTEGTAHAGGRTAEILRHDGRREAIPPDPVETSAMDTAVAEIVAWLDARGKFPYDAAEAVSTLEAIVAFHASHARGGAWVELPLTEADREIRVRSG
jgi:predicted dehydrogenase